MIAKVLNHVEHGVTAVYDRHSYDAEKHEALDVWCRSLREVLTQVSEAEPVTSVDEEV